MNRYLACVSVAALTAGAAAQNAWTPGFGAGGQGLNGPVYGLLPFGGELIAVGAFWEAGGSRANFVAAYNGTSWRRLGDGGAFGGGGFANTAYCAIVYRGELIVGGFFSQLGQAGGTTVNRVARWDGVRWNAMGACPGVTGSFGQVRTMAVYGDRLYVGGSFTNAGCESADNLAVWDGAAWAGLTGVGGETDGFVNALAVHDDMLVIGGEFDHAGPLAARGLAAWREGGIWVPIAGAGLSFIGGVSSLATAEGSLYAGGNFSTVNGVAADDIARYDGSWHPIGGGLFGNDVAAIASFDGKLYVGGLFSQAGGVSVSDLAAWNGSAWEDVNQGVNGYVTTMTTWSGALWIGGTFTLADGVESWRIARWGPQPCAGDFNRDGFIDFFDYLDFVTAFEAGDMSADVNHDEFIDFFDYLDFVTAFETGC